MRYTRFFALLLPIVLAGCGGGSGGPGGLSGSSSRSATVTIRIEWPKTSKAISRVIPLPTANPVINVEAFVGNQPGQRVGAVQLKYNGTSFTNVSMNLPLTNITFFANEYKDNTADPSVYVTDPTTGKVLKNGVALTSTEANPPLAHAVTSVNLTAADLATPIAFTLDNSIVGFKVIGTATYALNGGTQPLNGTIEALDANGASVLYNPADLSWSIDPTDPTVLDPLDNPPLMSSHASITSGGILTPKAVGTFHVQVSDTNVNGTEGQVPIVSSLTYQITNPSPALTSMATAAVKPADLTGNVPAYARSVELVVTQLPLSGGAPGNGDNGPPPISAIAAVTFGPPFAVGTLSVSFVPTGRNLTFTIRAWSEAGGKGVLIAETVVANQPSIAPGGTFTYNGNLFQQADYKISGFSIAPTPVTLYDLNGGAQSGPGISATAQLSVALVVGGTATSSTIDPRAVNWATSVPGTATVANGLVTAVAVGATNITVSDQKFPPPAFTSTTSAVTVLPASAAVNLGIN